MAKDPATVEEFREAQEKFKNGCQFHEEKKYQEAIEIFKQTASICPFDTGQLDKLKQRVAKEGFKLVQESIRYMGCAATHLSKLVEELDEGQKNQVPVDHELLKIFKEWNNAS